MLLYNLSNLEIFNKSDETNPSLSSLEKLMQDGDYQGALELINLKKDLDNQDLLKKAKICERLGHYAEVLQITELLIESFEDEDNKPNLTDALILKAQALNQTGKHDKALETIFKAYELAESSSTIFDEFAANIYNMKGLIFLNKGKINEAMESFTSALENCPSENLSLKSSLFNNMGIINWHHGELDLAIELYLESLKISRQINDKKRIAGLLNNIGIIYFDKGELELAVDYYAKSMEIEEKLGNKKSLALSCSNLGEVYRTLADYDNSIFYLEKSLDLLENGNDPIVQSSTYYQIILTEIDQQNFEAAANYFTQLERINDKIENKYVNIFTKMSKALVLKTKKNTKDIAEALSIFEEIVNEEVIVSEISVHALFNLCELLIKELEIYGNIDLLKKIEDYADNFLKFAEKQNSFSLRAQGLFIKSKIELLKYNINGAQHFLRQAQSLAEEKGLVKLAYNISLEHDLLVEKIDVYNHLINEKNSLVEILDLTNLDGIFNYLFSNKFNKLKLEKEEPISLLIIDQGGNVRLNLKFDDSFAPNEHLISSFITAFNSFTKDIFSSENVIERIKHDDYTILMKSVEELLICYIFRGNSFYAQKKMNSIVEYLIDQFDLLKFINAGLENPNLSHYPEFSQKINELFDI